MRGRRGPGTWAGPGGWGGRAGGWQQADLPAAEDAAGWVLGRLPEGWFIETPAVTVDRDEILVVGRLAEPDVAEGTSEAERSGAEKGRIARFREETRRQRMEIASHGEHLYGRRVSWGAQCGGSSELFTTQSVPVMTRLRQPERQVLDTLVDAGVARSRSDALAWCARLVGQHTESWLADLRTAMESVADLRRRGPDLPDSDPENPPGAGASSGPAAGSDAAAGSGAAAGETESAEEPPGKS